MLIKKAALTAAAVAIPAGGVAVAADAAGDHHLDAAAGGDAVRPNQDSVRAPSASSATATSATSSAAASSAAAFSTVTTTLVLERRTIASGVDDPTLIERREGDSSPPTFSVITESTTSKDSTIAVSATAMSAKQTTATTQPATTYTDLAVHPGRSTTTAIPTTAAERRGFEALALIDYPWQERLPDWEIIFSPGRDGVYGYTYTDLQQIEIFVRDDQDLMLLAHVIAHELGHAVDVSLNSSDERRQWQDERQIGDAQWWPGNGASDFSTGAGDFAEAFAAWQVGSTHYRSTLSAAPDASEIDLMSALSEG